MFNFRRDDTSFTQRCGQIRMQNLRHNPYVGSFSNSNIRHSNNRNSSNVINNGMLLGRRNPLVGTFRHSPSLVNSLSMGLKSILWEDHKAPYISQLHLAREVNRQKRIKKALIQLLPFARFSKENLVSSGDVPQCVICLEAFEDGDEFRTLSCSHCFHRQCIDNWLELRSSCPLCSRVPLFIHSDRSQSHLSREKQDALSEVSACGLPIDESEKSFSEDDDTSVGMNLAFLAQLDVNSASPPILDTLRALSILSHDHSQGNVDDIESDLVSIRSNFSEDSWLLLDFDQVVTSRPLPRTPRRGRRIHGLQEIVSVTPPPTIAIHNTEGTSPKPESPGDVGLSLSPNVIEDHFASVPHDESPHSSSQQEH
jgi:hypothetical protein